MPEQSTVLVVDDEIGPRESLRAVLKPEYRVLVATEGEQAVRVVEQEPVDIVLLDLRMPGLSGIRVMEKIKAIDPSIEVIVVTGYASYETVLEGLRLHAFDYIPKPFNVPHLRETVKRAAAQRHSQAWLKRTQQEESTERFRDLIAELAAVNTELEALGTSVSHNLRAPLQTISNLSQALLENYANQPDTAGKGVLERLRRVSQRMEQLINNLLAPFTHPEHSSPRGEDHEG